MKKAVAYMRMSTDKQEYSIDSQRRLIKDYAEKNKLVYCSEYIDEGISGARAEKRPSFMQMIEDSAKASFDCVLIYDSSRFARNLEQSIVYKSLLRRNGVELISITEPTIDGDTSLITDALMGAMNEMYLRKLSKSVKRGCEQKALRGEPAGVAPFGYQASPGRKMLLVDKKEAEIVRYVFEQYNVGNCFYSIAVELTERGIRSHKGHGMSSQGISYMLSNPVYKGYLKFNGDNGVIVQRGAHEAIIDEEFFDCIQERLAIEHAKHKRKARPPQTLRHWLSGLIRCDACGRVYSYCTYPLNRIARFRCSGNLAGACRRSCSFTVPDLEAKVLEQLRLACIVTPDINCIKIINKSVMPERDFDSELRKLEGSLKRAKDAYLAEVDTIEEYRANKARFNQFVEEIKIEQQQAESESVFNEEKFKEQLLNAIAVLESDADIVQKHSTAAQVIEKIAVDGLKKSISILFYA